MKKNKFGCCELCGLELDLTFHHLIPRTLHKNKLFKKKYTKDQLNEGINICRDCHNEIHLHISEKDMGRKYNTIKMLLSHPKVRKFIEWKKKRG